MNRYVYTWPLYDVEKACLIHLLDATEATYISIFGYMYILGWPKFDVHFFNF